MTDWENFGSLLENQIFPRMLKDHKYFHFRPFSDKTNDVVFLKISKTLPLCHFWLFKNFLGMRTFPQKLGSVISEQIWTSNLMHNTLNFFWRLIYEKFVWTPKTVWIHQNTCSFPEQVFRENMHISYNNTHKHSYYRLRTLKNRDNLDLLLYGEMIFNMSKHEGLQIIIIIIIIIAILIIIITIMLVIVIMIIIKRGGSISVLFLI